MKLEKLKTQHPGGWKDIIKHTGDKKSNISSFNYDVHFDVEVAGKDMHGRKVVSVERSFSGSMIALGEIEGEISGRVAATAWQWLRINGYPLPGDEKWMKPCKEW